MDYNNYSDFTWMGEPEPPRKKKKAEWRCSVGTLVVLLLIAVMATVLCTFTFTAKWVRAQDAAVISEQQQAIDSLRQALAEDGAFSKLEVLAQILEQYSYYSNEFDQEAMLDEVLRAYAYATGDNYAAYYSVEEYEQILSDNQGTGVGIGVSVVQTTTTFEGYTYQTYQIINIFKNAPAENSDLRIGDIIYAITVDGEPQTVAQLGGYNQAINAIRGEIGTSVEVWVFRPEGTGYTTHNISVVRNTFTKESVTHRVSESDPKVGIVHIAEFDLQTPVQFKASVKALQAAGVERFIFDVRNNPGGDLQSIRAVLSYLLHEGDLILSAVDNKGNVVDSVYAGAINFGGSYASCSVAKNEVGMFADLKMVVLCNNNSASAAEVFTASLRDHKNVTIIGETTYGKGIMQQTFDMSRLTSGVYDGYIKMTTYAYVTECGVTYHDIGIAPTEGYEVALSEEAKEYHFYLIPEALDNQLQKAIEAVQSK